MTPDVLKLAYTPIVGPNVKYPYSLVQYEQSRQLVQDCTPKAVSEQPISGRLHTRSYLCILKPTTGNADYKIAPLAEFKTIRFAVRRSVEQNFLPTRRILWNTENREESFHGFRAGTRNIGGEDHNPARVGRA